MSLIERDDALAARLQLHEELTVVYIVSGWLATFTTHDGNTVIAEAVGKTPFGAIGALVNRLRRTTPAKPGAGGRS